MTGAVLHDDVVPAQKLGATVVEFEPDFTVEDDAVAHALGTHLDLFQRIVVSPCSISAILHTPTGPIVLAVNSTGDDLKALVPS